MKIRLASALLLWTAAALGQPGCSSGSTAMVLPRITQVTVLDYHTIFVGLQRFRAQAVDFAAPGPGTLHIVVDWTFSSNDVDLILSNPACDTVAVLVGECKVLASEESNVKPARVTLTTSATAYRLFVINRGPGMESGTIVATVTQTAVQ